MTLFRTAVALLALCAAPALAAESVSPVGQWQISTGESRYDVVDCGAHQLCARLTWLRDDARTKANLALLDTYVVKGTEVRAGKWKGTAIYEGNTVDASMTMTGPDTIKLTGCNFLCKTMTLSRVGAEVATR